MAGHFQTVNRADATKEFVPIYNITGAALSAGATVELDVVTSTDGVAVTATKSAGKAGLFLGVADTAIADSAYGRAQIYGIRSDVWVSRASAGDTPGSFLVPQAGVADSGVTMSAATTSGHTHLILLDTITASAAYSSAAQVYQHNAFIFRMG